MLGVRSIGTSLSAVVAAVLGERGCDVATWTVRPHGHPFDRRLALGPGLAARLSERSDAELLVVDEGPGMSGSTFAATERS